MLVSPEGLRYFFRAVYFYLCRKVFVLLFRVEFSDCLLRKYEHIVRAPEFVKLAV